jgi:hypothetical protein
LREKGKRTNLVRMAIVLFLAQAYNQYMDIGQDVLGGILFQYFCLLARCYPKGIVQYKSLDATKE